MLKLNYIILLFLLNILSVNLWGQNPKREFRGIWIATVNNLDWPRKAGENTEDQKAELLSILDSLEELHFNAVFFQARPASDAFYKSETEPWSVYLTGQQGKAPENGWDPLQFMIEECHKRGMELHAWMNPYRVKQKLSDQLSDNNVAIIHPDWVIDYGTKEYLDPGIPAVREYLINIVKEMVSHYAVDAIHFDDYFYPYPLANIPFPDTLSFKKYNRGYSQQYIEDWRRNNVDSIIYMISKAIKQINPLVKFGISPFGVWKNYDDDYNGSITSASTTNFDNLYADVVKWQQNGWTDYIVPQIYWEIGHPSVDFITLANWWSDRSFGHHIYIGHALYKLAEGQSAAWKNPEELPEQILITRRNKNMEGSAYFRMKFLENNPLGFTNRLKNDIYKDVALLPTMEWLDNKAPQNPKKIKLKKKKNELILYTKFTKKQGKSNDHLGYLVYWSNIKDSVDLSTTNRLVTFSANDEIDLSPKLKLNKGTHYLWLTTLDKQQNESTPVGPVKIKIKK